MSTSASAMQWARMRQEWAGNRRLRLGALLVLLILGAHALLALSDRRAAAIESYHRDAGLLARLQEASRESAWPARAAKAEKALADARASIPAARSDGLAQAELQAWLTDIAGAAGLGDPRVRVESSVDVPGQPGLWQVLARLDATVPEGALPGFVRALSGGLPWIQAERLEIIEGRPTRVALIARGYYRRDDRPDGERQDDAASAEAGMAGPALPATGASPAGNAGPTPPSAVGAAGRPAVAGAQGAQVGTATGRVRGGGARSEAREPAPSTAVPEPTVRRGPVLTPPKRDKTRKATP